MGRAAVRERKSAGAAPAEVGTCRHHWIIETPRGTLSNGRCKLCGAERQFRNSATDYIWDDDSSSAHDTWGRPRSAPKLIEDDEMTAAPGSGRGEAALVL